MQNSPAADETARTRLMENAGAPRSLLESEGSTTRTTASTSVRRRASACSGSPRPTPIETSGSTRSCAGTDYTPGQGIDLAGGESPQTVDIAGAANIPPGCPEDIALWVVSQTG